MQRFETQADMDGRWRWRLRGANHEIVATSAETFPSRSGALQAADGAQAVAAEAVLSTGPGVGISGLLRFRALINGEVPPLIDGDAPAQTSTGVPLALSTTSMLPRVAFE